MGQDCVVVVDVGKPSPVTTQGCSAFSSRCNRTEWFNSIVKMGSEQDNSSQSHDQKKPLIQKVPKMLREIDKNKKCYDPMVVSIGPYHHRNPDLLSQEDKIPIARQFVLDICKATNENPDKKMEALYNKIEACNAREWYAAGSTDEFDDEEFTRIMLLDGCFVLRFIECIVNKKHELLKMKNDHVAFVIRDLFLLENQLPFKVLRELMRFRFSGDDGKKMINNFIKQQTRISDSPAICKVNQQPIHLLDLLRTKLLGEVPRRRTKNCFPLSTIWGIIIRIGTCIRGIFNCMGILRGRIINLISDCTAHMDSDWYSFRSVNELKAKGINCKRSCTNYFKDIDFKYGPIHGYLSLPSIVIDDSTKPKLLNMVAYEACPDAPPDFAVTSYICFLDSLIDHADDVKELRSKNILLNSLGSDEQVAELFNDLSIDLVPNLEQYGDVKKSIETHYQQTGWIWITEAVHTHFSSPWTAIAFFAAVFVIFLSVVQTVYTVYPPKET